jgi:hypothetical protein
LHKQCHLQDRTVKKIFFSGHAVVRPFFSQKNRRCKKKRAMQKHQARRFQQQKVKNQRA